MDYILCKDKFEDEDASAEERQVALERMVVLPEERYDLRDKAYTHLAGPLSLKSLSGAMLCDAILFLFEYCRHGFRFIQDVPSKELFKALTVEVLISGDKEAVDRYKKAEGLLQTLTAYSGDEKIYW